MQGFEHPITFMLGEGFYLSNCANILVFFKERVANAFNSSSIIFMSRKTLSYLCFAVVVSPYNRKDTKAQESLQYVQLKLEKNK